MIPFLAVMPAFTIFYCSTGFGLASLTKSGRESKFRHIFRHVSFQHFQRDTYMGVMQYQLSDLHQSIAKSSCHVWAFLWSSDTSSLAPIQSDAFKRLHFDGGWKQFYVQSRIFYFDLCILVLRRDDFCMALCAALLHLWYNISSRHAYDSDQSPFLLGDHWFAPGHPNDHDQRDCVSFPQKKFLLESEQCGNGGQFVCEKPATSGSGKFRI